MTRAERLRRRLNHTVRCQPDLDDVGTLGHNVQRREPWQSRPTLRKLKGRRRNMAPSRVSAVMVSCCERCRGSDGWIAR